MDGRIPWEFNDAWLIANRRTPTCLGAGCRVHGTFFLFYGTDGGRGRGGGGGGRGGGRNIIIIPFVIK